ncbi:MAG: exonuclease subunit SbcD, partial [Deltaproteobacteria bacterium]
MLNEQSREEEHSLFLDWLIKAASEHVVDAIVVAGDIFDSANPPQSAQALYYNFVSALFKLGGCSLVGLMAEKPADRLLLLPSSENPRVAIALIPFLRDRDLRTGKAGESATEIQRQLVEGIRTRYEETAALLDAAVGNYQAIATGHLTVAGSKSSDAERDIHIGGLGAVGSDAFPARFGYVALGHLHRPQAAGGASRVRYSG